MSNIIMNRVCSICNSHTTTKQITTGSYHWRHTKQGLCICHKCYCKTNKHKRSRKQWIKNNKEHTLNYATMQRTYTVLFYR